MSLQVSIEDDKVDNFSDGARTTLKKQIKKYADDIIRESNLIEEAFREDGASTEITSNIVLQAVRRNKTSYNRKNDRGLTVIKIVSALSLLATGFLFDATGYQNNIVKLIIFIIVLIVACVSTVLQFVFEDKG